MKNPFRPSLRHAVALALVSAGSCPAITPSEWQHRQVIDVPAPGLVRVEMAPATFDAAGPRQEDLRVLDPSGNETAILVDRPPAPVARVARPSAFVVTVKGETSEILVTTGTEEGLSAVSLETPAPFFMRSARVEISGNGLDWVSLDQGAPVFREWGAERLSLPLGGRVAAFVRVTVSGGRDTPLPFTGARLSLEAGAAPALVPVGARIERRDEFAGETVLTVSVDGRNVPLASIGFETTEPLFTRRVAATVREVRNAVAAERTVASGTIFRVALNGAPAHEQLELPVSFAPPTRELLIHIYNGDSPPLALGSLTLRRWPVSLLFMAHSAGRHTLLSGNPQAAAPQYDLAAFAGEMRSAGATPVVPGGLEDTPDYHERESLGAPPMPDVPLTGAPLDASDWKFHRVVQVSGPGVQELELDLDALANSRTDLADLRLLREGNQIPYILERPTLGRSLGVGPNEIRDSKRPTLSIWRLWLPKPGLPVQSVTLASTTSLFQRQFRIYETLIGQDGSAYDNVLTSGPWSRTPQPGIPETRLFELQGRMHTDTLWVETDNGDNPAIALGTAQVVYPVVRLVFKVAEPDGFSLAYGNPSAAAPRYDLDLVAGRLLTSSRIAAHLGNLAIPAAKSNPFAGINGGYIFWVALILVVIVLLATVARLLPKPPR